MTKYLIPLLFIYFSTAANAQVENVFINELMASNNIVEDEYGETDDWAELYNANDTPVSLEGLYLSDDPDNKLKWQIQGPVIIPPNGYILLWLDDDPGQGELHAPFKLNSDGESLFLSELIQGFPQTVDAVSFGGMPTNVSYGRQTDGGNSWVYFGEYSPGESNNDQLLFFNADLSISLPSGLYGSDTLISISCTDPEAAIRITTDGSLPSDSSTLYSPPLLLDQTLLLRAAAFKQGHVPAGLESEFYLFDTHHELPVLQLDMEARHLWDDEEGIYIKGTNGIGNVCSATPCNFNQDWERPVAIRYFEPDGSLAFHHHAGIKIGGGCSRGFSMKAFNVFFRKGEYGDDKLNYPLFKNLDVTEFKRFKLRCSGNDFSRTMIRDGAIQSMLSNQVDIDLMAYRPVVLYLNGEYWGVYGMREFFSKHYIAAHHNVEQDSLDILKLPYTWMEIKEGNRTEWDALTSFIRNHSFSEQAAYDYVEERIDINEFINYYLAELYIANYDWPANNIMVWRQRNNGKWRWMLYDLDASSGYGTWTNSWPSFNAIDHATSTSGPPWPNGEASTLFLRKLLQNTSFKNEFVQRACTFGQTIFASERATHFIDSLADQVSSEIPATLEKFNNAPLAYNLWEENPAGGSLGSWEGYLNDFKAFFEHRMYFLLQNFTNHFGFSGHFYLTINIDHQTPGSVVLHENKMNAPHQYRGRYFNDVPILIEAVPDSGYYFVRWIETNDTTAVISFQANEKSTLTPIFLRNGEVEVIPPETEELPSLFHIHPIPANTELTVTYREPELTHIHFRIHNASGQLIHENNLTALPVAQELDIDIRSWPPGVYFFTATIGDEEFSRKLLVNH